MSRENHIYEPDWSGRTDQLCSVNKPVIKKDALALVTGKPVYVDDLAPKDCLIVKVLRSPHANAIVKSVKKTAAERVPGIEAIYTWEDVPKQRFTMAGQTYPEPSPYDRLILDQHVRYVGDPVAIIAGKDEKCVDRARKLLKVEYEVLPAILDFHQSKDNELLVHPEESWKSLCPVGADNQRNLCASAEDHNGDVEAVLAECDEVVEHTYHVRAAQQAMMETFRTYCFMDTYGRLNVLSSTQIVYHARRILSNALGIPKSKIRVSKPRIGGGFGAKQTVVAEIFPAFVTWKTGKPSKMIFTREESQTASTPRHEMEVTIRLGAMKDGRIRAIDLYTLSNTGAYGEHGPTTVGLSGHKSIPMYGSLEAYRFAYDVVYSNVMSAGAYRGYGATQGIFAVESAVSEMAARLGIDPIRIREQNMVREGQFMPAYYGETANSCALDQCVERAKEMIGWDEKYPCRDMGNGKVRSVGIAMAMQGSCISNLDVGSATIKVNDDGGYTMLIAAADMGTGCDTILSQMAAECLECDVDDITVVGADTDTSPYDSGSYASSTTYITGKAVEKACMTLRKRICALAAERMNVPEDETEFTGTGVYFIHAYGNTKKNLVAHTTVTVPQASQPEQPPQPVRSGMQAVLSADGRYLDVTLAGRSDLTKVWFPTWSAVNGQDDLRWYEATKQPDGSWTCRVPLANHKSAGGFFLHAYGNNKKNLVAHTTASVSQVVSPQVWTRLHDGGRYMTVTLTGRSDLTKVWFPTWGAANGQDDLQWYQAVRQSNGDWSYTVNLSQHRDKGTYFIHVYGNTRQNLVAHTTAYVS